MRFTGIRPNECAHLGPRSDVKAQSRHRCRLICTSVRSAKSSMTNCQAEVCPTLPSAVSQILQACVCHQLPCMHAAVQVVAALDRASALPSLVVFDLDYTLWPYWQVPSPACEVVQILWADALHADLCILLPSRCEMKQATDTPHLYPEARQVLDALR